MRIGIFNAAPQVHVHYVTPEEEAKHHGQASVELCCHVCGHAILVALLWVPNTGVSCPAFDELCQDFLQHHANTCELDNEIYNNRCPPRRTSVMQLDFRPKPPHLQN